MIERYDAGLLNDFGGGDVDWWHDYIRAELERAHDFYESQLAARPIVAEQQGDGDWMDDFESGNAAYAASFAS